MSIEGSVAVVTGASRGIGAEIAKRLAAEGAQVAVAARTTEYTESRLPGTLDQTVADIHAAGGTAIAIPVDLSRAADRERLVAKVQNELGDIDILVNNAAVTYFVRIAEFDRSRYDLMFEVQVAGPMHLAQLVLPSMRDRRRGWILNISSRAAMHPKLPPDQRGRRGGTVYGMCKAALERFTSGLAAELYDDGIAVNALSPNRVVPTPGTIFHHLTTEDDPRAEPPAVIAEAALALCGGAPGVTGRITYSSELLDELGIPVPA